MDTPEALSRRISAAVSEALKASGISQREASAATGIPLTTLSRRLTGTSPLTSTELASLASIVHVTVSDLVARAETNAGNAA